MSSGKNKIADTARTMRERLEKQPFAPPKKKPKNYSVFQCKKCGGTPKMYYDDLVPSSMTCIHCEARIAPKIISAE